MCERTRSTHSLLTQIVGLLDCETAAFSYHGQIDKAKACAELASIVHDALVRFSQSVAKSETGQPHIERVPKGWESV